tara:strand:+ start:425 stop:1429 length:1005 start_codon:yes stop_codon:yes gene_type:complete
MSAHKSPIAVLGAGSWGTALALQLAKTNRQIWLWGRNKEQIASIKDHQINLLYLPGIELPENVRPETDLAKCLNGANDVLICVPSYALRETLTTVAPLIDQDTRVCWATKGFELSTGQLPHQIASEILGDQRLVAVLSGPTFAMEVGKGLPTAIAVAASNKRYAEEIATLLSNNNFRAYTSGDMIGVEVGGAVKNVLAIAAGVSDGLGFGANSRIALITRGLAEMTRLGVAIGAQPETFMGLSGIGDLVLTCTDDQSRNRRLGLLLATGKSIESAQLEIGQVVEGVRAAKAVKEVATRHKVVMPICFESYRILYKNIPPNEAVYTLMGRTLKPE